MSDEEKKPDEGQMFDFDLDEYEEFFRPQKKTWGKKKQPEVPGQRSLPRPTHYPHNELRFNQIEPRVNPALAWVEKQIDEYVRNLEEAPQELYDKRMELISKELTGEIGNYDVRYDHSKGEVIYHKGDPNSLTDATIGAVPEWAKIPPTQTTRF